MITVVVDEVFDMPTETGEVVTSGDNTYGQLGYVKEKGERLPGLVEGLGEREPVRLVGCGDCFTVVATEGLVVCLCVCQWGRYNIGYLAVPIILQTTLCCRGVMGREDVWEGRQMKSHVTPNQSDLRTPTPFSPSCVPTATHSSYPSLPQSRDIIITSIM